MKIRNHAATNKHKPPPLFEDSLFLRMMSFPCGVFQQTVTERYWGSNSFTRSESLARVCVWFGGAYCGLPSSSNKTSVPQHLLSPSECQRSHGCLSPTCASRNHSWHTPHTYVHFLNADTTARRTRGRTANVMSQQVKINSRKEVS